MKLTPELDPELPWKSRRRSWPIRSIGQLMIVIALSGLVLSVVPLRSRRPAPTAFRITRLPGNRTVVQGPVPGRWQQKSSPRDPFVIIAAAEIDSGMVVQADPNLDAAMVFNPEAGRSGSTPQNLAPGVWTLPQPPAVPQARSR
jgi:hypothetical protein